MNRFSAREFAFLCAPVALVMGVGWFLARRPAPEPLHLEFRVEKPTVLEAFKGADAAFVTQIRGADAENLKMDSAKTAASLELKNADGFYSISAQSWSSSNPMASVWKGGQIYREDALRLPLSAMVIPQGALKFKLKTKPLNKSASGAAPAPLPSLEGEWPIDRAQFQPFDFAAVPREPLVRVRAVKIAASGPGLVQGEVQFDLLGADMNAQTPVDISLSGTVVFKSTTYGASYDSQATVDPKNPLRRTLGWNLNGPMPTPAGVTGDLSGRISVAGRWPLAFQVEPIDLTKIKAGQTLKFRQWPVAAPKL